MPEAYHLLTEALAIADRTVEGFDVAELHRLQGELLLHAECDMQMADCPPEDCFQRALDVARCQQAKSCELRAAASLARLRQSQDKCQDAYDLLSPVYEVYQRV